MMTPQLRDKERKLHAVVGILVLRAICRQTASLRYAGKPANSMYAAYNGQDTLQNIVDSQSSSQDTTPFLVRKNRI